jgi:hypothetical protein
VAELEEADPALVSEDLRLVAEVLAFRQAKERVKARPVNQGIVIEVEKRIFYGCCCRLLNRGLCLEMRTESRAHLGLVVEDSVDASPRVGTSSRLENQRLEPEYQRSLETAGKAGRGSWIDYYSTGKISVS